MKTLAAFLAGALAGATVALLLAPEKGEVTRRKIVEKFDDGVDVVADVAQKTRKRVANAANKANKAAGAKIRQANRAAKEAINETAAAAKGA